MTKFGKLAQLAQNYRDDKRGSFSLMFAVSAVTLIMAAGVAYDTNQLLSTKSRAQLTSDSIGLAASIYVSQHGKPPKNSNDGFKHNVWYTAKQAGVDFGEASREGNDVKFKVVYDDAKAEAVVHIKAEMKPAFMGAFGVNSMKFENKSVVKYSQSDVKDPASVFLVMDNSGSMGWGDKPKTGRNSMPAPGTKIRIDGLKSTVKDFNEYLGKAVAPDKSNPDKKFLRMGMTAYSSSMIKTRTVNPLWGTLPPGRITSMRAGGGTDSRQSMAEVRKWMQGEGRIHKAMNGTDKPLKYVIFMTDGVNNQQRVEKFTPQRGTRYWCYEWRKDDYSCRYSWRKPRGRQNWQEGRLTVEYKRLANSETLKTCEAMKREGVEVYTIGYALEPGYYPTRLGSSRYYTSQSKSNTDIAYNFLKDCASSPDHFVKAEDTDGLKAAFDKIGADIAQDVIRVAS